MVTNVLCPAAAQESLIGAAFFGSFVFKGAVSLTAYPLPVSVQSDPVGSVTICVVEGPTPRAPLHAERVAAIAQSEANGPIRRRPTLRTDTTKSSQIFVIPTKFKTYPQ